MRITHSMMIHNAIRHMQDNQDRLGRLQEKVATHKEFAYASDNPHAASQALTLRSSLKASEGYLDSAQNTNQWMQANELAFQQLSEILIRATTLVDRGLNDTLNPSQRMQDLGSEMALMVNQALDLANSKNLDQYIFNGFQVNTKPFTITGSTVNFTDRSGEIITRDLGPNQPVAVNINATAAIVPVLKALISARDALQANDMTALRQSLGETNNATFTGLKFAENALGEMRSLNGSRQRQVQNVMTALEKTNLEIKGLLSQKEDANMAEAISLLRNQETTYQAVLEVGQRAIDTMNLFSYLR